MSTVETALCQCGCGEPAPIARQNHPRYGWVKGQPLRYVRGHNNRNRHLKRVRYVEVDAGFSTPCWIWQLGIAQNGYGKISVSRRPYPAHRWYWEQVNGPMPADTVLDHLCRNRACVNPDHLEAVSHPENCRRGAATKLTVSQVRAIRRRRAAGEKGSDLAHEFGVSQSTICTIVKRRNWANVN